MQGSGRAGSSGSTESRMADQPPSGVRHGPFEAGERIALTDPKGRRYSIVLGAGAQFHTAKGPVNHDDLIGRPEGVVVTSARGVEYLAMRPLLREFTVAMPRGAAVIYPKDAALIVMGADIFPGATVLEAGAGSGALSCALLRALASTGRRNVEDFFGQPHPAWDLRVGDLVASLADRPISPSTVDRVILDMLAPWECVAAVAEILIPGGVLCCYVATTTQLAETIETLRAHTGFTEPEATESLVRAWHVEGLAVRPGHGMVGHTGFLITTRRMAPGVAAPLRKRRPAPGAYGENYSGPRMSPS